MVRGPDALTMSFMTRADSQPWQVRWPEVKYSSRVTRLTPLKGSRIWVALVKVSAIGGLLISRSRRDPVCGSPTPTYSRTPSQCVLASDFPDFAAA